MDLTVHSIRRYPVKAMAGEYLTQATVDSRGLVSDRLFAVCFADGKFATGKNSKRFRRADASSSTPHTPTLTVRCTSLTRTAVLVS